MNNFLLVEGLNLTIGIFHWKTDLNSHLGGLKI